MPVKPSQAGAHPDRNRHPGLRFRRLPNLYAVVRLASQAAVPDWAMNGDFTSITRTAEELSLVCPAANVPPGKPSLPRWMCLQLEGPFPFSQTGVLLSFIQPLSNRGIPIFVVSTYDTDYVLAPEQHKGMVLDCLRQAGHELVS